MFLKVSLYANAALLIACVVFWALWQHADGEIGRREGVVARAQVAALDAANKRAAKLQKKLDTLPKAEESIREVVRDNPAKCDRPAPVAKRLREAIREANAAGAVPAHP